MNNALFNGNSPAIGYLDAFDDFWQENEMSNPAQLSPAEMHGGA